MTGYQGQSPWLVSSISPALLTQRQFPLASFACSQVANFDQTAV
jgi:hypothetical protein